jgi:hypothetical protein
MVNGWSIEDAAALLHPPMTARQVRALIDFTGLAPIGRRPSGPRGGRPAAVYDPSALMRAHAVIVPLLASPAGL